MNVSLTKLQTKHQIGLFCIAAALGIAVFFALFLAPQRARVEALSAEIAAEKQRVLVIENYALAHPDATRHANELNQKITQSNHLLPTEPDIGGFLVQLEQIAKASGVQISQIQPAQPVSKKGYQEIPVTMLVKGSYFQILDFMNRLEGAQRFSSVSALQLQAKTGLLEGKLMANVYVYGQGTATPAAAVATPK